MTLILSPTGTAGQASSGTRAIYLSPDGKTPRRPPYDLSAPDQAEPRSAENQAAIWRAYEELVAYAAENLSVITSADIVSMAKEADAPSGPRKAPEGLKIPGPAKAAEAAKVPHFAKAPEGAKGPAAGQAVKGAKGPRRLPEDRILIQPTESTKIPSVSGNRILVRMWKPPKGKGLFLIVLPAWNLQSFVRSVPQCQGFVAGLSAAT